MRDDAYRMGGKTRWRSGAGRQPFPAKGYWITNFFTIIFPRVCTRAT